MAGVRLSHEEQRRLIMDFLQDQPMTVEALARKMLCSLDMVRKRLRELQKGTRMVRVVGWEVKGEVMVRVWGVGAKRRRAQTAAPPSCIRLRAAQLSRKGGEVDEPVRRVKEKGSKSVPYRLEAFDAWLFAVRRGR